MCKTEGPPERPAPAESDNLPPKLREGYRILHEDERHAKSATPVSRTSTPPDEEMHKRAVETSQLAEIMGGTLTSVLILVLNITYAGVIMSGSVKFLPYLSHGIAMCLACTAFSNVWLLFARRNLPFISVADSFMAVLFATAADNIARTADEDTSLLGTLGAAMFMCSVVSAAGYVAVGSARVCNIVQFVPSPVMAGYQASIGYLLLDSAATLASGCSLMTPQCFYQRPWAVTELVFGAGLGIVLQVAQRHTDDSATRSMLMPALLIITSLLFQLLKLVLPTDLVDLQAWSLEIPSQQSIFTLGADLDIGNINWPLAAHEALLTTATAFVPNLLGKLLQYSALESKFDTDVDYNQEIRHAGWSQLVASPAMMVPTVTYLGMIVAHDMGARSFVPPAMVVGTSAALVFSGSYIVTLVPKAMFAALLFTSGLNLIYDNLKTAYSDLQRREFALVVLHIGLTAVLGMLSAVVLGMLLTATIFIVQYSSHSGVLQSATSLLERSKVARDMPEQEIIEQHGASVLIIHLHGMIFFGSANSVAEEVKAHLATLAELQLPLRFLLLDFDRCSAIDSSAVGVLFQLRRYIRDARLIFACAGTDVLTMLNKQGQHEFEHFTTLDLALEHCENRLLHAHDSAADLSPPSPVVMLKPMPYGELYGMRGGMPRDGLPSAMPHLSAIDETRAVAGPNPSGDNSSASSDDYAAAMPAAAPAAGCSSSSQQHASSSSETREQGEMRSQRKRMLREGRGSTIVSGGRSGKARIPKERLPNPFGLPPRDRGDYKPLAPGDDVHPSSANSMGSEAAPLEWGLPHRHTTNTSGDESSDSSTGGGLATIYSPEQARAELRIEALSKMRHRFAEAMRNSYGARELEQLFEHCDIMLVPPNFTVVSSAAPNPASHSPATHPPAADGTQPPYLYILDRGHVSSYAMLAGDTHDTPRGETQQDSIGSDMSANISRGAESNNPRHRLAKYGPGAILGVASFVTPLDMPDLNIMPTAAISDTYCQLLRLPRSRCDELEVTDPGLCFRLYRLLVLISERRLQDHRMRVVASEAFKINVRPTNTFQRMLASGTAASGGATPTPLSTSNDSLTQFPGKEGQSQEGRLHSLAGAPSEAPGHRRGDSEGARLSSEGEFSCSGSFLQPSYGAAAGDGSAERQSHEISPQVTPTSTPALLRRDDVFPGPALSLFARPSPEVPLPPSQSFPGREANEAASLMSYQSAMLAEVTAEREAEREAGREPESERAVANESQDRQESTHSGGWAGGRSSFLWPSSLGSTNARRQPPQL